jgi:hypothetical protein
VTLGGGKGVSVFVGLGDMEKEVSETDSVEEIVGNGVLEIDIENETLAVGVAVTDGVQEIVGNGVSEIDIETVSLTVGSGERENEVADCENELVGVGVLEMVGNGD